jgi:tRNA U34 5-methylaminomethyl-2-thiouridine-forming methyltransferase MnmC
MNHPDLTWTVDGTPVSRAFDDPYFTGGLDETRHVFLRGNGLPERLRDGFHVAELGFGTGLNLLALVEAWKGDGTVQFTSFEAWPMAPDDMARALAPFDLPAGVELVSQWAHQDGEIRFIRLPGVTAEIHVGDARDRLPRWPFAADAWFLDGFAPARNPELWEAGLLTTVAHHTVAGGTAATYTAAGHVRRALAQAGFAVSRVPGHGRKKHMTIARKPG